MLIPYIKPTPEQIALEYRLRRLTVADLKTYALASTDDTERDYALCLLGEHIPTRELLAFVDSLPDLPK